MTDPQSALVDLLWDSVVLDCCRGIMLKGGSVVDAEDGLPRNVDQIQINST